ncbi:MAG TPA: hypothetical protein VFQ61_32085 [Polyangiaceae bacterium]|nr:hypothetical protein [Polyangiaceae bacterium]
MNPKKHRHILAQRVFGLGIFTLAAYAGCLATPRTEPRDDGSSGSSGTPSGGGSANASGTGGKSGNTGGGNGGAVDDAQGGTSEGGTHADSAGSIGNGGEDSTSTGGTVEGGAAGMASGGGAGAGGATYNECATGLVTCAGSPECTTDLTVGNPSGKTVMDCGACGVSCSVNHASSSACSNGICEPACSTGFADCNAEAANDGCEANLASPASCGACDHTCATNGVAAASCTDSKCVPACAPGFLDCNVDDGVRRDDGCEVFGNSLLACRADCASSGTACASNQVCNEGSCVAPEGLVKLTIPFTAAAQVQRYGNKFATNIDGSNSAFGMRLYAPGALGGSLFVYPTDSSASSPGPGVTVPLKRFSEGWADLEIPVGNLSDPFDPANLYQLTIEVESGTAGPWLNPTVIYVDSIWSTNGLVRDTFDTTLGRMVASTLTTVAGSTMTWVASPTP